MTGIWWALSIMEVRKQLGLGIGSKPNAQNPIPKQHFENNNIFFVLNLKLQIIRAAQGHWSCTPANWNSCFYSYTYKKTYLAVHYFTKRDLFCQFVDRKVTRLGPYYYLFAGDTSQVSIFSLHKIKMNKEHRLLIL